MPQSNDLDNEVGKAAKLGGAGTFVTETARAKRARCPLKRKTRNILGLNLGKFQFFDCYLRV
jgi:hypothetical protein